ncbi:hypothetical protein P7K49_001204 [Saguinus oedipus]|uniref:Uncharacterized protein n=1 Tax=Saguinus oedipus TaxID=9490 RepID=A0ABQ9WDU1_SAGOE|nr:hypothetical protein P7K49_001204 [Saguinus oedipus]
MTPSSDASEPVQNGNLSHNIEGAEAQPLFLQSSLIPVPLHLAERDICAPAREDLAAGEKKSPG